MVYACRIVLACFHPMTNVFLKVCRAGIREKLTLAKYITIRKNIPYKTAPIVGETIGINELVLVE
jgi:hypothetical protein